MILRQGLAPVLFGLAAGLAGAVAMGRLLSSLLFSVSATDPGTFAAVATGTLAVAAVACWWPARKAARTAPVRALRES